jgi:sec-independent protein translocase protein TatC
MATTKAVSAPMSLEGRMTLMEHMKELRNRLIKVAIAVVIGVIAAFFLYFRIFDFLLEPNKQICREGAESLVKCGQLLNTDPLEGLTVRIQVATYGGLAFAMPVIMWQFWKFITPGLYPHEKRYAIPFVASAVVLFVLGAGIAYWTLPQALDWLQSIGGDNLSQAYSPKKYFQLIVYMMLAFGAGFEFPIVLVFLQMVGVLSTDTLRKYRRYAIVGIVILVAVATPSGDPISMAALSIPMCLFYEISILVGRIRNRRRTKAAAAAA